MKNLPNIFKSSTFLLFLFALNFTPINTNAVNPGIDCSELVEECLSENPYSYYFQFGEWLGYQQGCLTAGGICQEMQE